MSILSILSKRWIPAAVLSLVCGLPVVAAAEPAAPEPVKAPQPGAPLTDETMLQMLRGMGHEPYKTGTFDDGSKYYWVEIKHDGWSCNVRFALSPSKQVVWLQAYLGAVPETGKLLPEALRKVIEEQNGSKGRFWISGANLYYQLPVDNRAITPSVLRFWIEEVASTVKATAPVWQTAAWTKEGKEAVVFNQKIDAAMKKFATALEPLGKAMKVEEGKAIDAAKLNRCREDVQRTLKEIREEMKSWKVPDSAAARELFAAYEEMYRIEAELVDGDFAEIVQVLTDTELKPAEKQTKIAAITQRITAQEKPKTEAAQAARAKFLKHYGI